VGDGVEEGGDRLIVRAVLIYMAAVILATVLLGAVIGGTVYLVWWGLATFFDNISETD
jgi:hypothetical protein